MALLFKYDSKFFFYLDLLNIVNSVPNSAQFFKHKNNLSELY